LDVSKKLKQYANQRCEGKERDLRAIIKVSLNGEIKREWPLTYAL
jgi:hypothetical protein